MNNNSLTWTLLNTERTVGIFGVMVGHLSVQSWTVDVLGRTEVLTQVVIVKVPASLQVQITSIKCVL